MQTEIQFMERIATGNIPSSIAERLRRICRYAECCWIQIIVNSPLPFRSYYLAADQIRSRSYQRTNRKLGGRAIDDIHGQARSRCVDDVNAPPSCNQV